MIQIFQKLLLFSLFALLFGCASTPEFRQVQPGMTPQEVSKNLGEPSDRTFRGKTEKWAYPSDGKKRKVVIFKNGKVVELLNVDPSNDPMQVAGKREISRGLEYCAGSNRYGKYPEGGGCNLYGCWPKGGYCNGFGCSAAGNCTAQGCPDKISSYKCKD